MMSRFSTAFVALAGAAILGGCSDGGDALTSPLGTTVASLSPAVRSSLLLVVFEGAPPAGFAERVAALGGRIEGVERNGASVVVSGLGDEAAVALLRTGGVAGVSRVRE